MSYRRTRALLAVAVLTVLTATGTACAPQPEPTTPSPRPTQTSPTSTPTPTPSASPSERDQNITDAKNAYLAYLAAYDAAAQAGFTDPDLNAAVLDLTSGDARQELVSLQRAFVENGITQVGDTTIRSLEATEYREDDSDLGLDAIRLRACVDPSQVDTLRDGISTQPTDQYTGPRPVDVLLLKQPEGWAVHQTDPRPDERC